MSETVTNRKLSALFDDAEAGSLRLPNFQRGFVWSVENQRQLAASLLLGIPMGATLLLDGQVRDFSARAIGMRDSLPADESTRACTYVLDGQQRLSTLYSLIGDPFGHDQWADSVRQCFPQLRHRWVVSVKRSSDGSDLFGYESLTFQSLPTEPEQIRDSVVPMRMLLGSTNAWYHPAWSPDEGAGAHATELELVKRAAKAGQVPLWRVRAEQTSPTSLHRKVLKRIASERADELAAQLSDGSAAAGVVSLLVERVPDLVGVPTDKWDPEVRRQLLSDLAAEWSKELGDLFGRLADEVIPVMELSAADIGRAIVIFEQMNRGGTPLSVFDLLNARLARKSPENNLSELVLGRVASSQVSITVDLARSADVVGLPDWIPVDGRIASSDGALTPAFKDAFLGLISVFSIMASPDKTLADVELRQTKASSALDLSPEDVFEHWSRATDALVRAWAFLQIRCGVRVESDLRNKKLLLPIALTLRGENAFENTQLLNRLEYFYWASVLTGSYTERQDENALEDARSLEKWVNGSSTENPFSQRAARALKDHGYSDDATILREAEGTGVSTDVGTYLMQYELSLWPFDLLQRTHICAWTDELEDHHLVPLGAATSIGQSTKAIRGASEGVGWVLDSPLNRAFILKATNRTISSWALDRYLNDVPEECRVSRQLPERADLQGLDAIAQVQVVMKKRLVSLREKLAFELALLSSA